MACSSGQTNAETLEGFHEVNLASPTTPDLQNQSEQRAPARHSTPPTSLYRTHSLGAPPPGLPTSLRADQLPTQPVYSTPRSSHNGSVPGLEAESGEGNFLSGEDGEECSALSDSLSRLRSPSVMEVREKGYERLKEELAKAQRLGSAILEAVEQNALSVEPVGFQPLPVVKASAVECGGPNGRRAELVTKCALSGQTKTCKHRIKFGDSSNYYYVSPYCRYRITAVCNFFTYIRYIHQGLVKQQD
eukprot:superscaffoldBa00012069_g25508